MTFVAFVAVAAMICRRRHRCRRRRFLAAAAFPMFAIESGILVAVAAALAFVATFLPSCFFFNAQRVTAAVVLVSDRLSQKVGRRRLLSIQTAAGVAEAVAPHLTKVVNERLAVYDQGSQRRQRNRHLFARSAFGEDLELHLNAAAAGCGGGIIDRASVNLGAETESSPYANPAADADNALTAHSHFRRNLNGLVNGRQLPSRRHEERLVASPLLLQQGQEIQVIIEPEPQSEPIAVQQIGGGGGSRFSFVLSLVLAPRAKHLIGTLGPLQKNTVPVRLLQRQPKTRHQLEGSVPQTNDGLKTGLRRGTDFSMPEN